MREKDPEAAKRFIDAMQRRSEVSSPYSHVSRSEGVIEDEFDDVDTSVIKLTLKDDDPEGSAKKLLAYIERDRGLIKDVLSQNKVGGEGFVRSFIMGHFARKLGLGRANTLTQPDVIRCMLNQLLSKYDNVKG